MTLQKRPKKKAAATGFSHRELPDAAAKQSGFEGNQCKKVCHAALNVEPTRLNLVKGEVQVIGEGPTAAEYWKKNNRDEAVFYMFNKGWRKLKLLR